MQEWISQHNPDFIQKDEWPPNSPDLSPLDYYVWGAMLEKYKAYTPKPTNKAELETVMDTIWKELPQESLDLALLAFGKRLKAEGGHIEHLLN